jgi:hypothetical protein
VREHNHVPDRDHGKSFGFFGGFFVCHAIG